MIANDEEVLLFDDGPGRRSEQVILESNEPKSSFSDQKEHSNKTGFLLLACLSFMEALPLGLFGASIPLILTENGASFQDLGELAIMGLPYVLKILLAPLVDSTQPNNYGKRKSFIIPTQLIGGILFLIVSFWIEELVETNSKHILTGIGFLVFLVCAIQDVVLDGWSVSLISKSELAYVPAVQKTAQFLGYFLSFNAFIPLNSVDFCNEYIFSSSHTKPLISLHGFTMGIGITFLAMTILAHFFQEKSVKEEHGTTLHEIINSFQMFWTHSDLKLLVIFCLCSGFNMLPVLAVFTPYMIKQGVEKETITNIITLTIPVKMIGLLISGFINKKYKCELKILSFCYLLDILYMIFPIWIVANLDVKTEYKLVIICIGILSGITSITFMFLFSSWRSYCLRITHKSMATTFLVVIYSLKSFGLYWPSVVMLFLGDLISIQVIGIICIVFSLFFQIFLWKKLVPLQNKQPKDFGFYTKSTRHEQEEEQLLISNE